MKKQAKGAKFRPSRRFNRFYDALGQAAVEFGASDTISVGISLKVRRGMPLKIRVTPLPI
jgi:hypothetical protein